MTYVKLSRRKRSIYGWTQLWLAPDHVLMVRSTRMVEEYRRFQLADIQAVVASEVPPKHLLQAVLFVLSALTFLLMFEASANAARVFFGLLGSVLAGAAVYDFARGQRCKCRLLTEVSAEPLHPITRRSDFDRLMATLGPAVEASQGELVLDPLSLPLLAQTAAGAAPGVRDTTISSARRYLPAVLYGVILCTAGAEALGYLRMQTEGFSLAVSLWFGEIAVGGMLAHNPESFGLKGWMRILIYVTVAMIVLDLASMLAQAGFLIAMIAEAGRTGASTPTLWEVDWMMTAGKISIAWRVTFAIVGLLALWLGRERRVTAEQEVPPSPPQL